MPGWRLGWIIIHNRYGALTEIKKALCILAGQFFGPNTLVQGALPDILEKTSKSFHDHIRTVLKRNADIMYNTIRKLPG